MCHLYPCVWAFKFKSNNYDTKTFSRGILQLCIKQETTMLKAENKTCFAIIVHHTCVTGSRVGNTALLNKMMLHNSDMEKNQSLQVSITRQFSDPRGENSQKVFFFFFLHCDHKSSSGAVGGFSYRPTLRPHSLRRGKQWSESYQGKAWQEQAVLCRHQ